MKSALNSRLENSWFGEKWTSEKKVNFFQKKGNKQVQDFQWKIVKMQYWNIKRIDPFTSNIMKILVQYFLIWKVSQLEHISIQTIFKDFSVVPNFLCRNMLHKFEYALLQST